MFKWHKSRIFAGMKGTLLWISVILCICLSAQSSFVRSTVDIGNLGLSITNAGTIGKPDVRSNPNGPPSMQYPNGSKTEHLFEGGLWIGAKVLGSTRVSTGAVDDPSGYALGKRGYEFTAPVGSTITERSSLTNSSFYSASAISHQDKICTYTDKNVIVPGTTVPIDQHQFPLGADVEQRTYAYNFSYADYFVIVDYHITNGSTEVWDSVYLGFWSDLVVRNIRATTESGSAFFNKGGGGFLPEHNLVYAFHATPTSSDYLQAQSYGAVQFLGTVFRNQLYTPSLNNSKVFCNFWTFNGTGSGTGPNDDVQRYARMRSGHDFVTNPDAFKSPANNVQLLTMGPIVQVLPGEKINFTIAILCAKKLQSGTNSDTPFARTELVSNAIQVQQAYNGEDTNGNGVLDPGEDLDKDGVIDRFILPEPPATPKTKIVLESNKATIYWDKSALRSIDPISKQKDFEGFRLYGTNPGDDKNGNLINNLKLLQQWDSTGNTIGFNNGFKNIELSTPMVFENDTTKYWFKYELGGLLNGWQYMFVITAFDKGVDSLNIKSLESSITANAISVFPGTTPDNPVSTEIGVYPNPFRINAAWDGEGDRGKKIYFYNLPKRAEIRIYTLAGDIVATLNHDADSYNGSDIQWFKDYATNKKVQFSGGEHAWDVLSQNKQNISTGLYLYSVKNLDNGDIKTGKFAIIK